MTSGGAHDDFWAPHSPPPPDETQRRCDRRATHTPWVAGEGFWTGVGFLLWFPLLTLGIYLIPLWLPIVRDGGTGLAIAFFGIPVVVALIAAGVVLRQGHRGGCALSRVIVHVVTAPGRGLTKAVAVVFGVG